MADKIKEPEKTPPEGQDPLSGTSPSGDEGVYEFEDPLLKGKSPQEIEELFRMSKQVVSGQKSRLDQQGKELEAARTAPLPDPAKVPEKDFFTDPDSAMKRLTDHMDKQIGTLRTEIKDARQDFAAQGVDERMAAKHPDWAETRPYVDMLLAEQNFPNPNDENLLGSLYYTARGLMLERGMISVKKEPTGEEGDSVPKAHGGPIPQHRVSPPPPPPRKPKGGDEKEVTWDQLDETEKAMARYYKMNPTQFKEWQNADIGDVATSDIGVKKEKEA